MINGAMIGAQAGAPKSHVTNANPLSGLANTISTIAAHGAGAQANAVSFASQAAQGAFNQASANNANYIGDRASVAYDYLTCDRNDQNLKGVCRGKIYKHTHKLKAHNYS